MNPSHLPNTLRNPLRCPSPRLYAEKPCEVSGKTKTV